MLLWVCKPQCHESARLNLVLSDRGAVPQVLRMKANADAAVFVFGGGGREEKPCIALSDGICQFVQS